MRELALRYREQHGAIDRPGFTAWLRRQFSFAAFGQFGAFKPAEAMAESFAALSHEDSEPSEGHQLLFDLLARQANPETRAQWPVGDEHDLVFFHPDNTDRWGAHDSPTAVAAELAARHGLIVTGFDLPGVSVDTAREFARAIDRLLIEHPRVTLREIAIAPLEPGVFARTLMPVGTRSTQAILLNERFATDPLLFQHDWAAALESGFCTGPPDRPVYGTIVHEFGHALDAAGDFAARNQIPLLLALRYRELGGDIDGYRDWIERQLTRYSLHKDGTVNIGEALAEAFAAMDRDPTTVTEAQRLMYEILLRRSRGDEPTSEREM